MKAFAIALLLATPASLWPHFTFGRYNTAVSPNVYIQVRHNVSQLPASTLFYYLNDTPPTAMSAGDTVEALMSQIAASTAAWDGVATSALRVKFAGYTSLSGDDVPNYPIGIVRFSANIPPGAAATGGVRFFIPGGTPAFFPVTLSTVQFPTDLSGSRVSSNSFMPIMVHEIGHSLSAKHSINGASMFQTIMTTRGKPLADDDEAMISTLHPAPGYLAGVGSLSGRITIAGGAGASQVAVSAFSDTVVIGAYTGPDGNFTVRGLPPGAYKVMVQPIMAAAVASITATPAGLGNTVNLQNQTIPFNTDIDAAFIGAVGPTKVESQASVFTVNAGSITSGANVAMGARGPLRLEANNTFSFPGGTFSVGMVWVARGGRVVAGSRGIHYDEGGLTLQTVGPGVEYVAGSLRNPTGGSAVFPTSINFDIRADAAAVPGQRSLMWSNGADTYFSPGHVRVTATSPPELNSISPTSGAGGATVTIAGSGFNEASRVFFDGMPATITARSASSLTVRSPQGQAGRAAAVTVFNADGQGSEFLETPPAFTFSAAPAPSIAISPAAALVEETLNVTITGTNTHFAPGVTVVGFGSGSIVVNSVTVNGPTSLVANVSTQYPTESGTHAVTVVTGQEVAYLRTGFRTTTGTTTPTLPSGGIINGAAFNSGVPALSAGAIASIFGTNMSTAPASGVLPGLAPGSNVLATGSNGTRVLFDDIAAPLFFVSAGQLNVQVPFQLAGDSFSDVQVVLNGAPSGTVRVSLRAASPGLFTVNASGRGPAVVLNQDGSLNSADNPAPQGSIVQLFATGLGLVTPNVPTGQLAPTSSPLALSIEPPTVTIAGVAAPVEFSGLAPGFVGLWQVNCRVPSGFEPGEVALALTARGQAANPVTVFVR